MQWLIDLVIEAIGIPPVFIDRGDPTSPDFTQATLIRDGSYHELDLSAIVPADASCILLGVIVMDNLVGNTFWMRKSGNDQNYNISGLVTQVSNVLIRQDFTVAATANQKIEYNIPPGFDLIAVTVRGWWL